MSGGFLRGAHASHVLISASRRNRLLLHERRKKSPRWRDACSTQSTELRANV